MSLLEITPYLEVIELVEYEIATERCTAKEQNLSKLQPTHDPRFVLHDGQSAFGLSLGHERQRVRGLSTSLAQVRAS
eukprot:832213-Heterocapsa_arctica.AAC.1